MPLTAEIPFDINEAFETGNNILLCSFKGSWRDYSVFTNTLPRVRDFKSLPAGSMLIDGTIVQRLLEDVKRTPKGYTTRRFNCETFARQAYVGPLKRYTYKLHAYSYVVSVGPPDQNSFEDIEWE